MSSVVETRILILSAADLGLQRYQLIKQLLRVFHVKLEGMAIS